jgi:sulfur carrier protein
MIRRLDHLTKNFYLTLMTQIKTFFLNGETYSVDTQINLLELINYFNYNDCLLVLEYNDLIFDKKQWKNTLIQDLDKIEVVTIVGGG